MNKKNNAFVQAGIQGVFKFNDKHSLRLTPATGIIIPTNAGHLNLLLAAELRSRLPAHVMPNTFCHMDTACYFPMPDVIREKLAATQNRFEKDWKGQHFFQGRIPGDDAIILKNNDYLLLAAHPEVIRAQHEALESGGQQTLMSAVFLSGEDPQSRLEKRMADYFMSEEAVICQSGYAANLGLLQLLTENTSIPVYVDNMAHMSLTDGIRMGGGGRLIPFLHNEVGHLHSKIQEYGAGIVLVDTVYSTNGSLCPLKDIVNMAYDMGCVMIADESHSLGTHGPDGKGMVIDEALADKVMFRTASLSKAFAGRAGLILCPKGFANVIRFTSKPAIFSSALLPVDIALLDKVLDLVASPLGEDRRRRLQESSAFLRNELLAMGLDVEDSQSQIIALKTRSEWDTIRVRSLLERFDIYGAPFCSPATSKKRPLLRLSLHSELTRPELLRVCEACRLIKDEHLVASI